MRELLVSALMNGVLVTLGLFLLWSFVGGMRRAPAGVRVRAAMLAGVVAAVATVAVTSAITAYSA